MSCFATIVVCITLINAVTASLLTSGPHIADVNILLPPKMTFPVEYRLQGTDGCFKWTWDHHEILSVLPEYNSTNHCSTSARLRSIAPFTGRRETAVYASDVRTGIVIRCKVFIDKISRVQIFHNSIKLDLDGLATLRTRAFDSQDNVFSSLVGLQFKWDLMPESDGSSHHLVHVPLKDSPLSDCGGFCGDLDIQIMLEDNGVFSDLFVVKGIGIGHESVSVRLLEPQYKHMNDKIVLTVAEAMSLEPPSPVYVLIGAAFQYTLKVIRANVPQVVTLPSPHHRWFVHNSSIAEVDSLMGLVRAHNLGVTAVVAEDIRVASHIQVSSLNVVIPQSLYLQITALSISDELMEASKTVSSMEPWYVVSSRDYLVEMKVLSLGPDAQEIYITESDDLKLHEKQSGYWTTFPLLEKYPDKHERWNSEILRATAEGSGMLTASLRYFSGEKETKEALKVVQEIMVCDPVKFSLDGVGDVSHTILLPWAPGIYQEVELKVTGGCAKASSDYRWFTSDISTILMLTSGVIQAKKPGKATVKVVSKFDSLNFDEVVIEVAIPSSMNMLQNFNVETVVGSYLQAAVTMKTSDGAYFYKCDAFHPYIKWKAGSESFVVVNSMEQPLTFEMLGYVDRNTSFNGIPCSWTNVYASGSGQTMLHATLSKEYDNFDISRHATLTLKASSRIAAYPPLVVQQVGDGNKFGGYGHNLNYMEASNQLQNLEKLFLVPRTSVDVILVGGPTEWDKKTVEFIETIEVLDGENALSRKGVRIHHITGSHQPMYRILCQDLGNYELIFKRGNLVGDDHPLPALAQIEIPLACSFPTSIALVVDEPVNSHDVIKTAALADRNAGRVRVTPVTVANGRTIRIAAVGIADSGEAFTNCSSFSLKWELSSCNRLAYWDDDYEISRSSWEKFLVLQNESGKCFLRASVTGFVDEMDTLKPQGLEDMLTDAVHLQLVSTLKVSPEFYLLFFNPDAKVNLSISGGSCFWEAAVNDSQVVEVIRSPQSLQCLQLTLSPKGLGTALVTIHDIGLAPPTVASALVQVADVDWVKIVSEEEISLMEGQSESINLMAGTDDGSTFDPLQSSFMTIRVIIEDNIVELVDIDRFPSLSGEAVNVASFRITAMTLGITTLYVTARQHSGHEVQSQPIKIEVYAPLRIHPSDIFLAPGASYALSVKGGPTMGIHVEFESKDDDIATVEKFSGRLSALSPGNATIISSVYGKGGSIICKAYGNVKVGVPSSAIINVQSEQLDIGREMSIYPSFPEGGLFSFYELCTQYQWTVDDEKVLSFNDAKRSYDEKRWLQSNDLKELGFLKVIYGRSPGRTSVVVAFSCDFKSASYSLSRLYEASTSLLVVPKLPLALGTQATWVLPPHYVTSPLLPFSFGSHGQWESKTHKGTITYSVLKSCGEKEVWLKDVIFIDGDRIRTTESNNMACIQAKDRITGRIEIASCVRIAEVAQISIRSREYPFHSLHLAVGAEVDIEMNFHDALGNPFYEAYDVVQHEAETNYHDVVSIESARNGDQSIHLKAKRHGKALVRVYMMNIPQKSDYLLVSVGAHVFPQNPVLHQGNSLNLSLQGTNEQISGYWYSANESVLSIDMLSGKAKAIGIGSTQVLFECPSMKLQTAVTVIPGNIVSVEAPKDILTNVADPAKGYDFLVWLSNNYHKMESAGDGKAVSYDCKVDPPFIGYAKPWVDFVTGNSYCRFFPHSPEHLVRFIHKLEDIRPYVHISMNASLRDAKHISGSASALFIGGFSILEMDKGSMQINFTPDSNRTTITILGNTDVKIQWPEQDLMVIPVRKEELGIGGRAQYEVKMLKPRQLKDKIIIMLPATGQRVEIDVSSEFNPQTSSTTLFGVPIIIGAVTLITLTLGLLFFFYEMSSRSQPSASIVASTPVTTAVRTPERSSPVYTEQSPRTPQPYVEYLRNTIDETPHYRREARRRFNPHIQNTY